MGRNVIIPAPLAFAVALSLLISLSANVLDLSLNLIFEPSKRSLASSELTFPVTLRPATLTTVKSGRFGLYANSSDWDSILPHGDGFFYHPDDGNHYLLAHYHNLHCLRSLRHYLDIAMVSNTSYEFTAMDIGHVDHCLIYLRQIALCNADVTLEPASHKQVNSNGKVAETVTGVGVMHRCVDWSQIWEYMEENFNEYKDTYQD